jgi:ketosteroid isomerase-like protein
MGNPAGTARRVFDAYNTRDPEALGMLYAPTARTRRPGWPDDGGVDEFVASAEMDMVAFPDLRMASMFSATEGGATGTTGETFPATGRSIEITGVIVHETDDDGLIVAERQYWNMLELLAQLGMFAPMPEG